MTTTTGFHFIIDRSGSPAFLDPGGLLALSRIEGDFQYPDQIQATVRVIAPGLVTDVQVIGIGKSLWQTNPLTGRWEKAPENTGFNPATLFDAASGLQPTLEKDLTILEFIDRGELEELPGSPLYLLQGRLLGDSIYQLTYGLMGPDEMEAQLWIAPETFELHRLLIREDSIEGEARIWTIDFWDFDKTAEISPPPGMEE
jgi:hypothetical protein